MKRLGILAAVVAVAGLAGAARADDKASPTGTWKWTVKGQNGQERTVTVKLKAEGDKLTGAMPGRNNQETAIENGTYKDGEISFSVTRERNGTKTTTKYTGKLSGDTIKGKIEREGGQSTDWEATRAKDAGKEDK
ncbi:MAG: hypothetical protein ACJ8F7_07145 [Gemmataceae bacterium]